jgi:ATP-binding cassette subfamily B protein
LAASEFTVPNAYKYSYRSPLRWLVSHLLRYPGLPVAAIVCTVAANVLSTRVPLIVGAAFDEIVGSSPGTSRLLGLALGILAARLAAGALGMAGFWSADVSAQRLERDARDELFLALLGKGQTFHDRQRVGDVMARATNDVRQLNWMLFPGCQLILDSSLSLIVPVVAIGLLRAELLLAPGLFTIAFYFTLRQYTRQLDPVTTGLREQFGQVNAGLEESIEGIEVVKAYAQEAQERRKFSTQARLFRDLFVRQGEIQARYLPYLAFAIAFGLAFLHALLLLSRGALTVGEVVAYMGLMSALRYPTFISIFTFSLVQLGLAAARRILELILAENQLDENQGGIARPIRGEVAFDRVTFEIDGTTILRDVSFAVKPGQSVAIVGQTGSGKTTLTRLINRTYDVTAGRILIDGVDVRDWSLESLRSQVSAIEQDVFLFSRSVADNVGFGDRGKSSRADVERATREAQAHEFVAALPEGYETVIGERGVTLSGGQRQRLAIARALLADPRILILDDATSAIDSATEDQIQRAIWRVLQSRTTFLITHRLSQIRWADHIVVLQRGEVLDQGSHDELLQRCPAYRSIFVHTVTGH